MIIYKDVISDDEIISDTYKIVEAPGGVLWEADCKKYTKGADNFQLEGANPSAEEADDGYGGGEGEGIMVHDIEEGFQLNWLKDNDKPSKDQYKSYLKSYVKKVNNHLKESGASAETIKEFQAGAAGAVKKILSNYDNYDVFMGSSMNGDGMHVLIDFRDDGVTPYATVWKHGLKGEKV
ncbi:hypothetical protein AJ80_03237 [Polytolypa hystricis UAMH7299]|uniref:Translationally-controlled tumor protein homolog n=1 Tax=Polytolypa hystricis (strain UAMH7299) TaxID=1447883 RepID=A0A2B7YIR0_POLH7|nr:hypothetical protein AJ80_03237 [Polytolypa hystricis UAMH7299]